MNFFFQFLGKLALVIAILIMFAAIYVYSGFYNVAATTGHLKPVEQVLRRATVRSVANHAREITPPAGFNSQDRALGERAAGHYEMMCRTCHGAPGKKADPWQLYPPAPDLTDALRVTRWTDAEVFWIIKNGIKDTGMSAFGGSHDDADLWALTALIRQLQTMAPEQYRAASEHSSMKEESGHESQSHPPEPPPHKH